MFEVEAGADEKQQIKFVWPNGQEHIPQVVNAEQYKLICVPSRLNHYSAPWHCLVQLISWPTTVIDVMIFSKL